MSRTRISSSRESPLEAADFLRGQRFEIRIGRGGELLRVAHLALRDCVGREPLDQRVDLGELLRVLAVRRWIGLNGRIAHEPGELLVPRLDRFQFFTNVRIHRFING
jgi:hypothetical protein